jgi:hypothetical protein
MKQWFSRIRHLERNVHHVVANLSWGRVDLPLSLFELNNCDNKKRIKAILNLMGL